MSTYGKTQFQVTELTVIAVSMLSGYLIKRDNIVKTVDTFNIELSDINPR